MEKKFKVVVSDTVSFAVKGFINDENGKAKAFKFQLTADRVEAKVVRDAMKDEDFNLCQFMAGVTKAWDGQRLVLNEDDGQPADFCPEALDALLNISGVALLCFNAYSKESGAREKN